MDVAAEIKKAFKELIGNNPNLPLSATIVSIENDTCTIKLQTGLVLSDVRLKSTISEAQNGLLIVPKLESEVIVLSQTGELSGLMVIKVDVVESIKYNVDDFEFLIDGTTKKVTIKNSGANVGALLSSLIDTVKAAQVVVPSAGTGTIDPVTQAVLETIKNQFKTILNDV